jgi:hypothetical protein
VPASDDRLFQQFLVELDYTYGDEIHNPALALFFGSPSA